MTLDTWMANKGTLKTGGFQIGFGQKEAVVFDKPGTYYYVCQAHIKGGMKGKILVLANAGKIHKVTTMGNAFTPNDLKVGVGDVVQFVMALSHNAAQITEDSWKVNGTEKLVGGFDIEYGATKLVTFDKPGVSHYICEAHAKMGMKGRVTAE